MSTNQAINEIPGTSNDFPPIRVTIEHYTTVRIDVSPARRPSPEPVVHARSVREPWNSRGKSAYTTPMISSLLPEVAPRALDDMCIAGHDGSRAIVEEHLRMIDRALKEYKKLSEAVVAKARDVANKDTKAKTGDMNGARVSRGTTLTMYPSPAGFTNTIKENIYAMIVGDSVIDALLARSNQSS